MLELPEEMLNVESLTTLYLDQKTNSSMISKAQRLYASKDKHVFGYLTSIHDTRLSRQHLKAMRHLKQQRYFPILPTRALEQKLKQRSQIICQRIIQHVSYTS